MKKLMVSMVVAVLAGGPSAALAEEDLADQVWEWEDGMGEVPMGSAINRTCFLQNIGGDFEGSGEDLYVTVHDGKWWLGGHATGRDIWGAARCVNLTTSPEVEWNKGQGAQPLHQPASTHTCFLTKVWGKFHGASEYVDVYVQNGMWYVSGTTGQSSWIGARARCVARPSDPSTFYEWNWPYAPVAMKPTSTHACTMSRMRGKFENEDDYLQVYPSQSNGGGVWMLGGNSWSNATLQVRSHCFPRN